jgi:hypothetical protein
MSVRFLSLVVVCQAAQMNQSEITNPKSNPNPINLDEIDQSEITTQDLNEVDLESEITTIDLDINEEETGGFVMPLMRRTNKIQNKNGRMDLDINEDEKNGYVMRRQHKIIDKNGRKDLNLFKKVKTLMRRTNKIQDKNGRKHLDINKQEKGVKTLMRRTNKIQDKNGRKHLDINKQEKGGYVMRRQHKIIDKNGRKYLDLFKEAKATYEKAQANLMNNRFPSLKEIPLETFLTNGKHDIKDIASILKISEDEVASLQQYILFESRLKEEVSSEERR